MNTRVVNTRVVNSGAPLRATRIILTKKQEADNRRMIDERNSLNVPYLCLASNELYTRRIESNLRVNQ